VASVRLATVQLSCLREVGRIRDMLGIRVERRMSGKGMAEGKATTVWAKNESVGAALWG